MPRAKLLVAAGVTLATLAAVLGVAACYDVDALRGGIRDGGASPEGRAPESFDAGARSPGFCATADAAICDDFDDGVPLEEKWRGVPGLFPGIILQGDAGIDQVQPTGAPPPSSPSVLSSRLGVELRTSAMLGASIGRSESVRAFEMEATIRVASWTSQADGGFSKRKGPQGEPLKAPAVGVLGAGGLRLDVIGASLDLSPEALLLRSGIGIETVEGTDVAVIARHDYRATFLDGWVHVGLVLGERDLVLSRIFARTGKPVSCPASPAVAAAWASRPDAAAACITLTPTLLPLSERDLGGVVGGTSNDVGTIEVLTDDVLLRALP